jgi:hypothetical protein
MASLDATLASASHGRRQEQAPGAASVPGSLAAGQKHPFVQLVFRAYETIKCLYVIKKVGFRYRQAETARLAAVARLKRTSFLGSAVTRLRKAHSPNNSESKGPLRNCVRSSREGQFSSQPNTTNRRNGKPRVSHHQTAASDERWDDHQSRAVDGRRGFRFSRRAGSVAGAG